MLGDQPICAVLDKNLTDQRGIVARTHLLNAGLVSIFPIPTEAVRLFCCVPMRPIRRRVALWISTSQVLGIIVLVDVALAMAWHIACMCIVIVAAAAAASFAISFRE